MKEKFNCLDEAFNLPYSNICTIDENDNYTKSSNIGFDKKKRNILIEAKPQILKISRNEEIYYEKESIKYSFDIDEYIDRFIDTLKNNQKEYLKEKKLQRRDIRQRRELKEKERNIQKRNEYRKLKENEKCRKYEEIKNLIKEQKSKIYKRTINLTYIKEMSYSWIF